MVALGLVLPVIPVCRDWAFIDRNTGSRKGYREWFLGSHSGSWYRESAIEAFMRSRHPTDLRQEWVSYAGTSRNIFGDPTYGGHGRPGSIVLLKPEALDTYCRVASESEKRRLYDLLVSQDEVKIRELVEHIIDASMESGNP